MAKTQKHTTKGIRPPKKHSSKVHAKVYWPYLPLVVVLIGGLFLNIWQPLQSNKPATLAYATEMSRSALLNGTNSQRSANGSAALTINSKLNAAAQAKANDMVARDYWSHNTPDGEEPWVFIDAQGYNYTKAGENLAYGFDTSNKTIIGWMNSPSHRANLLDVAFTEVGFGYANSENFVGTGEETIVVAMYGTQAKSTVPAPQTAPASTEKAQKELNIANQQPAAPENIPTDSDDTKEEFVPISSDKVNQPFNTETSYDNNSESERITLLQQLTGGDAPWSTIVVSVAGLTIALVWLFKHVYLVRKFIIEGEHFVAHHPVLDLLVVMVLGLAVYLSQTSGVIQ